jgi:CelD/BcsL family acetyltransferase involved in cellulose biosynthesis
VVRSSAAIVERIEDPAVFADLREEWNALLSASPADCLFLTWEWLCTWWKHLGGRRRLRLLLVRDGRELVAIAPLTQRPPVLRRLLLAPALEFLGTGTAGSDYLDVIIRSGRERMAFDALVMALADIPLVLDLGQVDRESSFAVGLARRFEQQGWSIRDTTFNVCPIVDLAGHSWESYLASLSAAHRYNFQRRLRTLEKSFDVQLHLVQTEAERCAALEALIALHTRRWRDRGGSEAFGSPALLRFYDEVTQLALTRGWLRLFVLRLDGRAVAVLHGYQYGRTFYFYQSGFDPAFAKHSVGLVTMGLTIRHAIQEGAVEYDLLRGAESYKFHWARRVRELGRLELFAPGVRGAIYRRLVVAGARARKTARRLLGDGLAQWVGGRGWVRVPPTLDAAPGWGYQDGAVGRAK